MLDGDLAAWIDALHGRLERGDLADLGPVEIGYGTKALPAELAIRIKLADLDGFDDLALAACSSAEHVRCRQGLLDDFRRLRELLG
jgi:hypothetical protein